MINTDQLIGTLNNISILSPQLQDKIRAYIIEEEFAKKTLLLKAGQVAHRIYFVKKGLVRSYFHQNENQFTNWFMGDGEFIISVYSFFTRKPSFESIEVLEDCILQSINWDQLQALYNHFPEFNKTGRLITEHYYIRSEEKNIQLQTLSATQRYQNLLNSYPGILQKASLGQIASFLNIKQETLSRIRAAK
ncbi:CRP-like cAMP-binding protein [Mucilaginibacter gracilis]|uniref:CRP-like cAMP-binding protein n=1 Tax=Mucilaginibacter gracilis TaxID=423350 RepID=A0A495IYG9_9SPHI|nr:Crp/Fnr family transcriptional regulator [Mucilaginibacter gracilis]RKR81612.1 CRP-like cAMP-binding protein [Mucilaginibacter gracilis]